MNTKKHHLNLSIIYKMLGCSKQNVSYWETHSYSTQSKKSIYKVIHNSIKLFNLSVRESEALANSAGLTLHPQEGNLYEFLNTQYKGKLKKLYENALVSERMMRYYKTIVPTKQVLLAIAVSLNCNLQEIKKLLCTYGYCLSDSVAADIVVTWFVNNRLNISGNELLKEINIVLDDMGLPLLMTRQND